MGKLLIFLLLLSCTLSYEIVYSFNCGSEKTIHSPLVVYNSDEMYEGLKSRSHKKDEVPSKFKDPSDIELLTYERMTEESAFSYLLKLTGADHYFLLLKFIEVVHDKADQRVFQVKLGDEVVSTVDIVKQVRKGEILNKWIEFQLRDDVLYLNKTIPVLNGYIYPKQTMKLTFSKVIGFPKIEALILLKGADATRRKQKNSEFFNNYFSNEKKRMNKREQLTCQKYQRDQPLEYKQMTGKQKFDLPLNNLEHVILELHSFNTLFSIIAVAIVLLYEKITKKLSMLKEEIKEQ